MIRALPISALLVAVAWAALAAQKNAKAPSPKEPPPPPRVAAEARPAGGGPKTPPPNIPRAGVNVAKINNPLNPVQRFLQMTPEEQERFMEKANPQQQERLRQAIERYKNLRPAQREWLFRQYQVLNALPPARQALISRQIGFFNNKLPDERRRVVGEELVKLHDLPAEERTARLASDEFKSKYSPEEQQLLKDLAENLPPDYPLHR